jgi:hypothetical protein
MVNTLQHLCILCGWAVRVMFRGVHHRAAEFAEVAQIEDRKQSNSKVGVGSIFF